MPETTVEIPVETPVETPKTKTRQMSFTLLDTGVIRADFGPGLDPLTLNPSDVPESLHPAAVAEGLISRARQSTSKLSADARTSEALREAIAQSFKNLLAGVWKIDRVSGGSSVSIEVEAAHRFKVARAASKNETFAGTIAETATAFAELTDAQKVQLKALPRFQAEYAQVKAERAAAKAAQAIAAANNAEDDMSF